MANRRELEGNSCAHSGLASITGGPEVLLRNGRLGSSGYSTGGCLWKEGDTGFQAAPSIPVVSGVAPLLRVLTNFLTLCSDVPAS